jgi:hypothetical protein
VGGDATPDGVAAQPPAGARREQRVIWPAAALGKPDGKDRLRLFGQWDGAMLASFALDADVAAGVERDVAAVDGEQLGHAQAGLECEDQHRAVTAAFPTVLWWRVDQRPGLGRSEVGHGAPVVAFGRDGQDAFDDGGVLGVTGCRVAKQRSDGCQS